MRPASVLTADTVTNRPHLNSKYLKVVLLPTSELLIAKVRVCDETRGVCKANHLLLFFHI